MSSTKKRWQRPSFFLLLWVILVNSSLYSQQYFMYHDNEAKALTEILHSFIEESLQDKDLLERQIHHQNDGSSFHLFSHGQPSQLLINNQWLSGDDLVSFLRPLLQGKTHLNIYGCHFAQGEKGKAAVAYLETALGISVAASDDLTGVDGDWDLEVGNFKNGVTIQEYSHNLQQGTLPIQPGMAATTCGSFTNADQLNSDRNGYVFGIFDIRDPSCPGTPGANAPNAPSNWAAAGGTNAYHHPSWTNANLGEVFGVDLEYDQASSPDIFLSSGGLADISGGINPEVLPMVGGTGGEVFRIDGTTGAITVMATLPNHTFLHQNNGGLLNNAKFVGLGNLSYNAIQKKLYVTNLEDGNIYVVDATTTGVIDQTYNPTPGIADDTNLDHTQRARMVYGIEYNKCDGRVYYSRPNGTNADIFSVELNTDGTINTNVAPVLNHSFATSLPYAGAPEGALVSDIEFSDDCTQMLTSERELAMFDGTLALLAHNAGVQMHDVSGATWTTGVTYDIGTIQIGAWPYVYGRNAGGGVSFGYSNYGSCDAATACSDAMVATGDALVYDSGASNYVYGLQISDIAGTPNHPTDSYFIDLDGKTGANNFYDKYTNYDVDVFGGSECFAAPCSIDADGLASVSCTGTNAITFSLTPTGTGTSAGGNYNVSVSSGTITPTSGTYGAATTFTLNDSSAGSGGVTVTLTDGTESSCTRDVAVADPGTCTYSLGNQVFTDTDNSGDLNGGETGIDGVVLQLLNSDGSVYDGDPITAGDQAVTVTTADGGYYRFDGLPAGDYIVEVVASNFAATNSLENLVSSTGAAQEADPNTDGDSNDNGLAAEVSGATRSAVITLGTPEPTGEAEPGTYGAGSTTGTAAADLFSNLTVDFGFYGICNLTITENAQSACNDNSTSSDASDDYFTIDFNATSVNGGTQYQVVEGANADGTGGTVLATSDYGTAVTVGTATTFDADGTSTYAITVRDATTNTCHQEVTTTSVESCSATCVLTITENAQSACNDNSTNSDASDDYFTIDFNATSVNGGTQYQVVEGANADGTGGTVLATSDYGTAVTVGTATTFDADGTSTYAITVRDATTNTCHQEVTTTSVESCSATCVLTITENAQSACNDNSTSSDASDDYFTIDFNATSVNGGTQYQVVEGANADGTGGTVLATSDYGTAVTVGTATTFDADGTSTYAITVRDATTNTCHQEVTTTSVESCSATCVLTITENAQSACNDNSTSSDASDDYFTIDFNATSVNGGTQYEVVEGANADGTGGTVLATSDYGTAVTVGTATTFDADGTSTYAITVRDATTNTCHQEVTTTSVESCSATCVLTITENAQSACNDNSTNSDASDDYFTIDFNATSVNGGTQYQVVEGANADGTGGTVLATSDYGTAVTVGTATTFDADGTSTYAITVRDATTNTCHQEVTTTSVESCSATCVLTITENAQSACNDNSTNSDASDDYFTIDFNATSVNGGTQYQVVEGANADGTGGTVLATSDYGTAVTVGTATTFDADGTSTYAITVRDATTNTCHQEVTTTSVESCSATCVLTITENAQSACNDNSTNSDASDDYFTIDFNATSVNGGTQYQVVEGANADGTGGTVLATSDYGTAVTVGTATTFDADGTSTYAITVRDATTNTCHQEVTTTSVESCSATCVLTITENTQSSCNDNGTNRDASDDYFTLDFNATAVNGGTQYQVVEGANADGTGGTVLATSDYGTAVTVGTATTFDADGTSTYAITVRDATTNTCHQEVTTTSVESCAEPCPTNICLPIEVTIQQGTQN